jgi:DNA polymerase V
LALQLDALAKGGCARFGRGTVGFGAAGERHGWKLRREFISPRYTTVWDELLRV